MEDTDKQDLKYAGNQERKVSLVIFFCVMIPISCFIADPGRARAAAVCAAVFVITIWTRRHLGHKVWFWTVLVILATLHLPLILLVRWSDASLPVYGLVPIMLVDFAFVCGPIWLIEEALSSESKIS